MTTEVLYDPTCPETIRNPYPAYRRLREQAPAYYVEKWNAWAVSRFDDVWQLANDAEHLTARHGTTPPYLVTGAIKAGQNLNHMDPPEQQQLRAELMPFFMPAAMRKAEPRIRTILLDCLAPLITVGKAEAFSEIGQVVAARIAAEVVGIPEKDREYIIDFLQRFFASVGAAAGTEQSGADAMTDMRNYLADVAAKRRAYTGPPEHPLDVLLRSTTLGGSPSDATVGEHLIPLLVGATETFPKLTAAVVYRLWQHQDQRKALVEDPELIPGAVQECLRVDMPTQWSMRRVVKELQLHGQTLLPGQSVMLMWASGNRDEREFSDPDRLDIHRRVARSLSFGSGVHRCVGAFLAELEGRLLVEELLGRAPEYEVDESGVESEPTAFFQGFSRMPVRF